MGRQIVRPLFSKIFQRFIDLFEQEQAQDAGNVE
jgi:hypothetical protein